MKNFLSGFSRLSSYIWPIERKETRKFIGMFVMFFLMSFNYNILRGVKDTFIVTAPHSGAEAIPFLKVWVILPMALGITAIFARLLNRLAQEKVFYVMMLIFLGFFAFFTFVLYPAKQLLEPTSFCALLTTHLPKGFHGLIAVIRNWPLSAYYVMSELWGTAILNVLFWSFANQITSVKQAKRFYSLLGVGANFAGTLAGQALVFLSKNSYTHKLSYGTCAWDQSVFYINSTIVIAGILIMAVFRYLNHSVLPYEKVFKPLNANKAKIKMSLRKSFSYLIKSKYLLCIAIIVITYNIGINLTEVLWKNQVKQLFPHSGDYNVYMGQVMTAVGILATVIGLLSGSILRKFSWTLSALIPPIAIGTTAIGFFSFYLLHSHGHSTAPLLFGMTPLALCVFFGSMQNCVSRALKYTLLDATKEIAYIPLDDESKLKGKTSIDGVASRIGKSGGSVIYQGLLIICSTLSATTPFVAIFFALIIFVWIGAVKSLGKRFADLTHHLDTPEKSSSIEITNPKQEAAFRN